MRIAFFHELPPGGAKKAVEEFGRILKKNHTIDLYYVNEKKEINNNFSNTYFYKFLPKRWKGNNWQARLYKDTLELLKLQNLHKKIARDIDIKQYDFVITNASRYTQSPYLLRFLNSFKLYYSHDPHLRIVYEKLLDIKNNKKSRIIYEKLNRALRKHIDRKNILSANLVIANSLFTKKGIKKSYDIDSFVSYLGVNIKTFKPLNIKKIYDLLFVGSTAELDGYYDLQHIINYLPKINVKILDFKTEWISSESEMNKYYNKSKIVICLAYNEPFGLVPLEAMASSVPVIAVNEGGYVETIKHNRTGYLIKRDPKLIAEKIQFLLANPNLSKIIGEEGRKEVEKNWTWEISTENLISNIKKKK